MQDDKYASGMGQRRDGSAVRANMESVASAASSEQPGRGNAEREGRVRTRRLIEWNTTQRRRTRADHNLRCADSSGRFRKELQNF
jgi:hypothetical protein